MTTTEETQMRYTYIPSPLGELLVTRDDEGLTGLYLPTGRHATTPPPAGDRDDAAFEDVRMQLAEYFAGRRTDFVLPLHASGTAFQKRVWTALCDIPYGRTASYGQTAAAIGAPTASRAVGLANGQNPISIIVPCHRVVGANGSLTGYGGGLEAKRWLLEHEKGQAGLFAS
ncbi:MAG TPA: methylated-DNA--[protein]-cysteine S-methyltransferase [Jatrophihabitantaceae bacterium]|jgi:methylated-DNA-[protein]-cysteine S-methyltransferase